MSPAGFHPPFEEYLAAILTLEEDGIAVIQARLARHLGHSAPTVSEVVNRLEDRKFLKRDGRSLHLTKKGRRQAEDTVRKHRLAERLLTDILGLDWHQAHHEAERWEHVLSDLVVERIDEMLNHPTTCPHGNPIPGRPQRDSSRARPLGELLVGESFQLVRVPESIEDHESLLSDLHAGGVSLFVDIELVKRTDTVVTIGRGAGRKRHVVDLPADAANRLIVERTAS